MELAGTLTDAFDLLDFLTRTQWQRRAVRWLAVPPGFRGP